MIGRRKPLVVVVILVAFVLLCDAENQNQDTDFSVSDEQEAPRVDGKTVPEGEENSAEAVFNERLDDDHNPTNENEDQGSNESNVRAIDTVSEGGEGSESGSVNKAKDTTHGSGKGVGESQTSTSYSLNEQDSQDFDQFQSQTNDTEEKGSGGGVGESQTSGSHTLNNQASQELDEFQSQTNDTEEKGSGGGVDESQASSSHTLNDQALDEFQSQTHDTDKQSLSTKQCQPSQEDSTAQGSCPDLVTENSTTTSEFASSLTSDDSTSSSKADPVNSTGNDQTSSVPGEDSRGEAQSDRISSTSSTPAPPEDKVHDPDYLDLDATQQTTAATAGGSTATPMPLSEVDTKKESDEDSKEENAGSEIEEDLQGKENAESTSIAHSDETNRDKPLATEKGEKPVEGSLASFLQKAKNKEPDLAGHPPKNNMTNESVDSHGSVKSSADLDPLDQPAEERQYVPLSRTWGVSSNKRYADISILGLLFNKTLVANASSRYNKIFEPIDGLVIPTLHSKIMGGELTTDEELVASNVATSGPGLESLADQRSVNTEFVEGLDDLDKFFEGVDPPDELDVGAAGSSIQDVLMGQTTKIIFKRVTRGWNYASGIIKAGKTRLSNYLANEEQKPPAIRMEHLIQARAWLVTRSKDVFLLGKDLYESIFNDEEEVTGDEFLDYTSELQKKLQGMTNTKHTNFGLG